MIKISGVEHIIRVMEKKGHKVFKDPSGHDLNIIGIRTADTAANRFNDYLCVFYLFDGHWNFFAFPATTDPGTFYRENPINVKGTAILKPGQYRGMWKIGRHKGYKALQQNKPATVYRDADRDKNIDVEDQEEQTGMFGINCHRANSAKASTQVDKWSAGCQVFQDPDHYNFLLNLCQRGADKFGNSFTYTLLIEKDFKKGGELENGKSITRR